MNKKVSFSQSPAYLTKVKKEKTSKGVSKSFGNDAVSEQRHEKINFKQYLRDLQEQQTAQDEYADIPLLTTAAVDIERTYDDDDLAIEAFRTFDLGGEDGTVKISEADWDAITDLAKDESINVYDERQDRFIITRTPSNLLVIESEEYTLSGKYKFDEVIKKLK